MSKNVECSNQVTPSVDLMIAEKTNSMLSDLKRDFEDLRKCIRNYIPDYAVKHEQIYSLVDICKIYSLCNNIVKNRDALNYGISYQDDKDPSKELYTTPLKWCKVMKCFTNEDIMYIDNYLERFNYLNHFLSATRTLNVDVHNAIHTVFKNSNSNALDKVYTILDKASDVSNSYVSKKYLKTFSPEHDDYGRRWDAYSDYFFIRGYDNNDEAEFEKLYNEWSRSKDAKEKTFYEWVRLQDIRNQNEEIDKPCIECADDFNTYCEYRELVDSEEKYNKLFEDWLKNFKSKIPFGAYLVENGYFIDSKKPKQKKKVKSNTEPEVRS